MTREISDCTQLDTVNKVAAESIDAVICRRIEVFLAKHASADRFESCGRAMLVKQIQYWTRHQLPIRFALPAFPMKSPSRAKVLGPLPDRGEEIALLHLEQFCQSIADVYNFGCQLVIISDGVVYQDLVGVAVPDFVAYHRALRQLAADLNLKFIVFSDISEMLEIVDQVHIGKLSNGLYAEENQHGNEEEDAIRFLGLEREHLLKHQSEDWIVKNSGENGLQFDENSLRVYQGFIKFLETDLAECNALKNLSRTARKKHLAAIAKQMMQRGDCFSNLVAKAFPTHIRLSIHGHDNGGPKFAIKLFPRALQRLATPWHNIICERSRGDAIVTNYGRGGELGQEEEAYEIRYKNGRPWCLMERDEPLLDLMRIPGVVMDRLYPFGMILAVKEGYQVSLMDLPLPFLRECALRNALVLFRGFQTVDQDAFRQIAAQMGAIQRWVFGDILVVKEDPTTDLNNVLTREAMPMHFDGNFKMKRDPVSGNEVPDPPLFQFFHCAHTADDGDDSTQGLTLYADTSRILNSNDNGNLLGLTNEELSQLRCEIFTEANQSFGGQTVVLPLVDRHPLVDGRSILRFHEPWPAERTSLLPTHVKLIQKEFADSTEFAQSDILCQRITDALYSRHFCYYHRWQVGDFLIADNFSLMHTRTAYTNADRELWRIHLN